MMNVCNVVVMLIPELMRLSLMQFVVHYSPFIMYALGHFDHPIDFIFIFVVILSLSLSLLFIYSCEFPA